MSLQFSTTYRNNLLTEFATTVAQSGKIKIWTGSVPANCGSADTGTEVAEWDLGASGDWGTASGGTMTLSGLPLSVSALATGTAGYFREYDSAGTCHMQGTVTATGGGGDLTVDNTSFVSGQTITLTGYTLTAPGA